MKKILVANCEILLFADAEAIVDTDVSISADGVEFPKAVIGNYELMEVTDLPDDFSIHNYLCVDGQLVVKPPVNPRELSFVEKEEKRALIQAEIDKLERDSLMNRGARELDLAIMKDRAQTTADANGVTVDEVLATIPYYVKLKALNDRITSLRNSIYDMGYTS